VLDTPHPMPVGPNVTTGFDTVRATPNRDGPGQLVQDFQPPASNRVMRSESLVISTRARVDCITAAWRPVASAVVISRAAWSVAIQSRHLAMRGSPMAASSATMAMPRANSMSENPLFTLLLYGCQQSPTSWKNGGEKRENAPFAG
jgi:hypothetical protein